MNEAAERDWSGWMLAHGCPSDGPLFHQAFIDGWEAAARAEGDRIRRAVEALPTNHVNWYGPDGEHEDHGYVVRQADVYDLLEPRR